MKKKTGSILILSLGSITSVKAISLVNTLVLSGETTDLSGLTSSGVNTDRLGGFISDLYYDRNNDVY